MSFLQLRNLEKTYPDGTQAVRGIDLDIEEGEFIVLLGPSGCGKTTSLRMIAGLETPTGGTIILNDHDVTTLPPSQRDIGFVFQFYALYPHMTVRQNIAFPLENLDTAPKEIDAIIDQVSLGLGIQSLLDRHPGQLSGGDQQRVSLARAMVRKPDVYLLDEPLGTLDAEHRLELREFIRKQQLELSVTAIYVTHDQEEAMSLADRIVVMSDGLIRQTGTPSEIYHHPAGLFVANFVGSPGMNLLEGRVLYSDNKCIFKAHNSETEIALSTDHKEQNAVLGIRPEFIQQSDKGIDATVSLSEYLGSHTYLHIQTPLGELVMKTEPHNAFGIGDTLKVMFEQNHINLFDAQTGNALP